MIRIISAMMILERQTGAEAQAMKTKEGTTEKVVAGHRTTDVMTRWDVTVVEIYRKTLRIRITGEIIAIEVSISNWWSLEIRRAVEMVAALGTWFASRICHLQLIITNSEKLSKILDEWSTAELLRMLTTNRKAMVWSSLNKKRKPTPRSRWWTEPGSMVTQ